MDRDQAGKRILELRDILWTNSRRYYVDNAPTMSDFEYDHLMRELEDLEAAYPDLKTPDSPTQKVGSDLDKGFAQYPHKYPMLSLGNTYNIGEIEDSVEVDWNDYVVTDVYGTALQTLMDRDPDNALYNEMNEYFLANN